MERVEFQIVSDDIVRATSAVEIKVIKNREEGNFLHTLQDPRMGFMTIHQPGKCPTCNLGAQFCVGHFGHIELARPMLHPLYSSEILNLSSSFCYYCFELIRAEPIDKAKTGTKNFICLYCGRVQPHWNWWEGFGLVAQFVDYQIKYRATDVRAWFERFSEENVHKIGLHQSPLNFIFQTLRVLPLCTRPENFVDGKVCKDDFTYQYEEILKVNLALAAIEEGTPEELDRFVNLHFKIFTLFDNTSGKRRHTTNNRPYHGIKGQLSSKTGLVRSAAVAKRTNFSGRTVIGPAPFLLMDQVGVPEKMAQILTVPEIVIPSNLEELNATLARGQINTIQRGAQVWTAQYFTGTLQVGDKVARHLRDGDRAILNRQPTLHKGSMISSRVVILPTKTLCFNLCNTKSLNADFDGDEGNIHIPQSQLARAELEELSCAKQLLLSDQAGQANITLVQDNLLALYLMTTEPDLIDREDLFDLLCRLVNEHGAPMELAEIEVRRARVAAAGLDERGGAGIISILLPANLNFEKEKVRITGGIWRAGECKKAIVNALIVHLYYIFGTRITVQVINNLQFITNGWLSLRGFSIGLEDCLTRTPRKIISDMVDMYLNEAEELEESISHPQIREVRVQELLNKARDTGLKLTIQGFAPNNNFLKTIHSGSKGDFFNIPQISSLLGQQYFKGKRIQPILNRGTRALYHSDWNSGTRAVERGFIRNCFLSGLSPQEMFFHAIAGRSGVVDTAMGTGETGYMQRQLIKLMEDVHIAADQTVRDERGNIYQFLYGNNGLDVIQPLKHLRALISTELAAAN